MDNKYTNTDIFTPTECPSEALLLSYVKDKIGKEDKRAIELHLIDCDMCNDMVEGYQRMHPTKIEEHINDVHYRVDTAVKAHKSNSITTKFKWFYAAAAILLIALTGILYQFYFTSLKESNVADLPNPHQHEINIVEERESETEETLVSTPPEIETIKFVKPNKTEEVLTTNKVAESANDAFEIATDNEAPAPVQTQVKENFAEEKVAIAEPAVKSITDINTVTLGNNNSGTQNYSAPGATTTFSQPASTILNPTILNAETINLAPVQEETIVYNWNADTQKDAKFKAKSTPQPAKKAEAKNRTEQDSEKAAGAASPNFVKEALTLLNQKKYTAAIQKFNAHLVTHPTDCEAVKGLATCYESTNQLPEAIISYNKLTTLTCAKSSDQAYLKLGMLYLKNNQKIEAKTALQKAKLSKYSDIAEQAQKELDKL